MPSRRHLIAMDDHERRRYLEAGKTIYLASNGHDGFPHLIAMWYGLDGDSIVMTTFRKSQKVANLRRDPRCSLLLESGATYSELRGLFLRGRMEVIDDEETTLRTLGLVGARAAGSTEPLPPEALGALRGQATKRVTLRFVPEKTSSWDHEKLGGRY